ncbi:carbamate kinase [Proteiniclasticum sp. QWL-01]|uniref:carbamate kinase n=1 Tax=Proteiniclasticum sp. QWL-01 TaxID=3036945 RepID=UPI00240EED64|nr:carbamate kinase [Proteiniclasticum sp. QWL-01]WFF72769.1 carbamate kinase [Proteiniclasticum sp. QWL-01]
MSKRIVIALGGNALGNTPQEQMEAVRLTADSIVDLLEEGYEIAIAHGNGPQVGMINLAFEAAVNTPASTPAMPFPECGAMSQGYIGYHLQNAIINEMRARKISQDVVTVVTEVQVDSKDPAFADPTKPVGSFYSKEEAESLTAERGYIMKEDAGRGYRRVVPSPKPIRIVGIKAIRSILDSGHVVIAGGGGGIPVVEDENRHLTGVAAVIDKDFTSELLAESLDADAFIILTAVEKVAIRFGKPDQQWLSDLTLVQAQEHIANGEFAKGSMLPKVEAAIKYAQSKPGRRALITSLEKAREALAGNTGTWISN